MNSNHSVNYSKVFKYLFEVINCQEDIATNEDKGIRSWYKCNVHTFCTTSEEQSSSSSLVLVFKTILTTINFATYPCPPLLLSIWYWALSFQLLFSHHHMNSPVRRILCHSRLKCFTLNNNKQLSNNIKCP